MINCIIVDDEKPALDLLEDNVGKVPFLHLSASCRNAMQALEVLKEKDIDLIFLDIKMPGLSGMELIQSLQNPPLIILVTAFEHYALEAFNLNVVDYLVKPVDFNRFITAANKALDFLSLRKPNQHVQPRSINDHIFVNAGYSLVNVRLQDIVYIEGLRDYVRIHLVNNNVVTTRISMRSLEEKLNKEDFMRIHKSFIVSLNKIDSVQKYRLIIRGQEIPIGESYRSALQNYVTTRNI